MKIKIWKSIGLCALFSTPSVSHNLKKYINIKIGLVWSSLNSDIQYASMNDSQFKLKFKKYIKIWRNAIVNPLLKNANVEKFKLY